MNDLLKNISKALENKNVYLITIISLVFCIVCASVYVSVFVKEDLNNPNLPSQNQNEDKVFVDDIRSGLIEVDKYDFPISKIDRNDFSIDDKGRVTCGDKGSLGIDVSQHQETIDWAKVKADGIDYAILRVGYRGATKGSVYEDTMFKANIEGAVANGIDVGVYFFSQAISVAEAEDEATFVLQTISEYMDDIKYPIVFDWEHVTVADNRTETIPGEDVALFANAFCEKIAKSGKQPMVYLNKFMGYNFYNLNAINEYPLWIAEYENAPSFYYAYDIWQYSETGTVDGINGNVDMNISFVDYK